MDQKRLSFFKNRKYKRVILPFCLTMLLGMIMLFSMPTVAKSAGSVKPEVPAMNISKIYTENMTSPSPGLYSAAGSADQLIKLYMLASDGFWSDDQRALLQAGGATAHYSTIAYTPGGLTWSWYAPYIEHEMWVNQMRYYVPTSTPTESIWMSTLQAPLNFYENKNAWVQREVVAPIPASTFISSIKANVIQPPNNHYSWGSRDYGWHDTNAFATNIFIINFSGVHPTVVSYQPTATSIISGQTLASSSLSGGGVMSETAYYTPMPSKYGISGTFKWQNPSQQLTTNTTVKAEFDPVYANFAKPDLTDISVTVRAAVVTLDKNGGTGGNASAQGWFNSPLADTAIPTKTGFDFKGYYSAPTGGTQYYNSLGVGVKNWDIAADTTLYAQWETSLSVSNITVPSAIITGSKLSLTNPTVVGSTTTKGWEYSANGTTNWIGFDPAVKTYTASENQYYIRYYATNGTYTAYSNSVQITVTKNASALIINTDNSSTTYPDDILLTATLTGVNNFTNKTVKFFDGENYLGSRTVDNNGIAEYLVSSPIAGNHSYSVLFEGDTENSSVSSTNIDVTVSKGTQAAVTYESTADINKTYGAADFTLPTLSGGTGTGEYNFRSNNTAVATVSGNTVSIYGAGEATIYGKRNGDTNYNDSVEVSVRLVVAPKAVTIDGMTSYNKVYDGDFNTEIYNGSSTIEGLINSDDVQIDYTKAMAKFADKNAGDYISVSFSGFGLTGTRAGNYELIAQPESVHGSIYEREVTISGITANDKFYDGTQNAVLDLSTIVFNNIIDGDILSLSATGTFEDANAGMDKMVNIENMLLGGTSVNNYYISSGYEKRGISSQTTTTATINPKTITVTPIAQSKNYGQADGVIAYSYTDTVLEEIAGFTGALSRIAGETTGNYQINIGTLALSDNLAFKEANYQLELSGTPVNFTINSVLATTDDYIITGNEDGWNKEDLNITPNGDYTQISTDKINWSNSIILGTEGNPSTVEFYLKQADGTTTEKVTYTYKLDKTAPTATISQADNSWTKFFNTITFGLFFNETKTVTISGADVDGSGIASIGYYIKEVVDNKVELAITLDQAKAYTYTEGTEFNISPDKNIVVFAKIVDNAGNVTYINSQGLVFDETAPVISGITNGQTYYTTRELVVTDSNLDSITINGDKLIGNTIPGDIDMTYVVVGTDKAGNITTYTVTMKSINSLSATIDSLTEDNVKSSDKGTIETVKANVAAVNIDTATQAEKDKLQEITDKCDVLLTKISNIANEIKAVNTKLGDTTKTNGKSSDSERLGEVKIELERLLATDNLTDEEIVNLESKIRIINEALAKIDDVEKAIANALAPISNITQNNVTKNDGSKLDKGIKDLQKILADYVNNLTDTEKAMINNQIKRIQDIRKVLDEVKAVEDLIIALPKDIDKVRASFNKLSTHQQKLIDSVLLKKLDEFLNPIMKSIIIHPATGIRIEGINGTLFNPRTILVLTPIVDTQGFAKLDENQEMLQLYDIKFLLDGKEIQPEGKVKITLKLTQEQQAYKDLKVVFINDDGTVTIIPCEIEGDEVSFITDHFSHYGIIGVKVNISDTDRMTDTLEIISSIALVSIVLTAITIILVKKRKKDSNNK